MIKLKTIVDEKAIPRPLKPHILKK